MKAPHVSATIGIDLGGTSIKGGVIDSKGKILHTVNRPTPAAEGARAVVNALENVIEDCGKFAVTSGLDVSGVGIGTPGIVSADGRCVIGAAENITGWEKIDVSSPLEGATGLPVVLTNDANAMALGEIAFGAAKGYRDVLFLTVGTGIGGAVAINGELWRGFEGRGMEVGHITVKCDGEMCACGRRGCLEHYASTSALTRRYKELAHREADGRTIVTEYHEGREAAVTAMNEHWEYLGHGVASLINVFAPQIVVIGGGIADSGDFYIERLRESVARKVIGACAANTKIVRATLGNNAGLLGASTLLS